MIDAFIPSLLVSYHAERYYRAVTTPIIDPSQEIGNLAPSSMSVNIRPLQPVG